MSKTDYLSNFSYIFIPFCIEQEKHFTRFNNELAESRKWIPVHDEIRYLHRYVADRLINEYNGNTNLFHYRLSTDFADSTDLHLNDRFYKTSPKRFNSEEDVTFNFRITDVQLFSFNTTICMLAYKLEFENNDPFHIAAAQYYLRKISTEHISVTENDGTENSRSFIDLSKELLGDLIAKYTIDFFFYAASKNERANFFTYIDLPVKENYAKELFYLKWCYNDKFIYEDDTCENDCVNYAANSNTTWGISPSAAACIVNRTEKTADFVENTFQKNFQNQYLFTYIFLLHQKYMLYLFLTKISIDIDDDLNLLEDYKRRLYEFNTKYIFTNISEVPQYQRFYEKVMKAFSIKDMFLDVQEPLSRLAEIQRLYNEERQQKYDHSINAALIVLSLLTIVSAVADASGITSNLDWLFSPLVSKVIQISMVILVLSISILMIIRLFSLKNKR